MAEVLADLPSLDADQLLMVKSLEEAGGQRTVILDRIADLLVVQEAARHLDSAPPAPAPAPKTPTAPTAPAAPAKVVSTDLLDQMGGLLAKSAAQRTSDFQAAWPLAEPAGPALAPGLAPAPPPLAAPHIVVPTKSSRKDKKNRRKGAPLEPAPASIIMPSDGRRSRRGSSRKLLVVLIVVGMLAAGAAVYWRQTQKTKSSSPPPAAQPARDLVGEKLVKTVPAGFTEQPDTVGETGPSDLAKAVADDGAPDAQAVLTQTGFLHGYQRLWATADKSQILAVFVYHFRTPEGASAYAARAVVMDKAEAKPAAKTFVVTGIPGATGLIGDVAGVHASEAIFTRGTYAVGVTTQGSVAAGLPAVVQQVAAAQYALLPAA